MTCKQIYLGQDWEIEDLNRVGFGSVYLAGPRNIGYRSWRLDLIKKIQDSGISLTFLLPETKDQLNTGKCTIHEEQGFNWQKVSISCASAILFWFPYDKCPHSVFDAQSFVEFGNWCKSERVFLGGDPGPDLRYLDWLIYSEQKLHAANTLDELAENFIHWVMA